MNYRFLWFSLALLASGVAAHSKPIAKHKPEERPSYIYDLTNHVIRADRDGFALHTDLDKEVHFVPRPASPTNDFGLYVSNLLASADLWSLTNEFSAGATNGQPRLVRLLIHVHGGLNSWQDTVERMDMARLMMKETDPTNRYYPIFVAWPSAYWDCYSEHLVSLRQGNRSNPLVGYSTAPMLATLDLLEGVVNAPVAWSYQLENSKNRLLYNSSSSCFHGWLSRNERMAITNANRPYIVTNYDIWPGYAAHSTSDLVFWQYGRGMLTTPLRATLGTLAQGPTVGASWQVMKRRTGNLFSPPDLFEMGNDGEPGYLALSNRVPAGDFFNLLAQHIRANTNVQYRITFVGHSMGTILLNRLFSAHGQDWIRTRSIENIVYMGAACSVWQGIQALVPVLKGYHHGGPHPPGLDLKFYNVTLHPLAEMSEEMFWPAAPSGSLLHLIDTHLESPNGPLDRTLGSQVNVFSGIEAFDEVKKWCVFKGFDFIPGRWPAEHGDFNKCPFWREDFRAATNAFPLNESERRKIHVSRAPRNQTNAGEWTSTYKTTWQEEEMKARRMSRTNDLSQTSLRETPPPREGRKR